MTDPIDTTHSDYSTRLKARLVAMLGGAGRYEHWVLMALALVVGIIAGYAAIGFYLSLGLIQEYLFGTNDTSLSSATASIAWWKILLIPALGGLIVGQLLRFMPNGRSHSVQHVIEAAALNDGKLDLKHGALSALIASLSLSFGASMGREGPVVHLGATLASSITQKLKLSPAVARTLLGCGVAAAVSASFNAPIAGVFFAHEVIIGHYALHAFTPVVIAAVAGTLISRAYLGEYPAFALPDYAISTYWEFPAFFLLGIIAAMVAVAFMAALDWADKFDINTKVKSIKVPRWIQPAIGGLILGIIALEFPQILSVGYEATSDALNGRYELWLLISLVILKIGSTSLSMASGFGGGIFSPSLFIGAMTGGAVGLILGMISPELASDPGLYAVIGMGAVASSVLGAPISTTLIVFEITGDYSITIAVMIASAVSSLVSSIFYQNSAFLNQLANRGIQLEGGRATYLLKSVKVAQAMDKDFFTIRDNEPLSRARELFIANGGRKLFVTDERGAMVGVLTLHELPSNVFDETASHELTVVEVMRDNPRHVKSSDALEIALTMMESSGEHTLAVIDNVDFPVITGIIHYSDVMREYNRALLESQGK